MSTNNNRTTKLFPTQMRLFQRYISWHIPCSGKYILINIKRVSKHTVTILGLRVLTPAGLEPG